MTPALRSSLVESVSLEFTKPVQAEGLDYQDLTLTLDGLPVALNSSITFTQESLCGYRIGGLEGFTGEDGTYTLSFSATGVRDMVGQFGTGSISITWSMESIPPTIVGMSDITPDPRDRWITDIDLMLSEPIDLSTLTSEDVTLLRDGEIVPWDASIMVSQLAGSTYRIAGLKKFTSAPGDYQLIVDAAGIADPAGNAGVGTASDTWNVFAPTADIFGTVWEDLNGDRLRDPGEPGVLGLTVFLDYNNNTALDDEPSMVTAADDPATPDIDEAGTYHFTSVVSGQQIVRHVAPRGFGSTVPTAGFYSFVMAVGEIRRQVDFGNIDAIPQVIGSSILQGDVLPPGPLTYIATFDTLLKTD